jgi:hypothetical protein
MDERWDDDSEWRMKMMIQRGRRGMTLNDDIGVEE